MTNQLGATTRPGYLTTKEVAEMLRTSESSIRYWRACGNGPPARKVRRHVLYRLDEVEQWLDDQREIELRE